MMIDNMEMDVLDLLRVIEEEVENASSIPLSGKKMMDGQLLLDIVADIRLALPRQLEEARNIIINREQIIKEANKEADAIDKDARERAEELIENHIIVSEAKEKAHDLALNAQESAAEIREGADAYADGILDDLLRYMDEYIKIIQKNKGELKNTKKSKPV